MDLSVGIHATNMFNMIISSMLHSCLAVALHSHSHGIVHVDNLGEIFECAHLKYAVSGRSKQANIHMHMCKCSHASVRSLLRFMYPKYNHKPRFSSKLPDEI